MAEQNHRSVLSADQKLTVLSHLLRSVLTSDVSAETLWSRLESMGLPVDDLVGHAKAFSSPPYTAAEFQQMLGWPPSSTVLAASAPDRAVDVAGTTSEEARS